MATTGAGHARDKGLSSTAFVFSNKDDWPMPLFSAWKKLTPTVSGLFFKDVLAGKDVAKAGDGFGDRPAVTDTPGNGPADLHWNSWYHDDPGVDGCHGRDRRCRRSDCHGR